MINGVLLIRYVVVGSLVVVLWESGFGGVVDVVYVIVVFVYIIVFGELLLGVGGGRRYGSE